MGYEEVGRHLSDMPLPGNFLSMLLLPVRVGSSSIHGLGLFTVSRVLRGTPIWRLEPEYDRIIPMTLWKQLPAPALEHLRGYAFFRGEDRCYVKSGDFACFMNHSTSPTTGVLGEAVGPVVTVALRDLEPDEELTCDYWTFDAEAAWKLGQAA